MLKYQLEMRRKKIFEDFGWDVAGLTLWADTGKTVAYVVKSMRKVKLKVVEVVKNVEVVEVVKTEKAGLGGSRRSGFQPVRSCRKADRASRPTHMGRPKE
jgi:hypothetical protein